MALRRWLSDRFPGVYFHLRNGLRRLLGTKRHAKRLFRDWTHDGDLIFDIGANVGEYSAAFIDLGARVIAVEPQADLAHHLERRLRSRDGRANVVQAVVTDGMGDVTLHLTSVDALASVDPSFHSREGDPHRNFTWDRQVVVPGTTLDALIQRFGVPAGIKIDVEGHELPVLRGLTTAQPWIFFEATTEAALEVVDLLSERGYSKFWCRVSERRGWLQADPVDAKSVRATIAADGRITDVLAVHG